MVPSADLGRVHVNNKLFGDPQGTLPATPQATLPAGDFALKSSSLGQGMVGTEGWWYLLSLSGGRMGPPEPRLPPFISVPLNEKWGWQQYLSQGNLMRVQ